MTRYEQFEALTQQPRRLAIALEEYFTDALHRAQYGAYLQRRIRPAATALIQQEDLERLEGLKQWFTASLTDELLETAIDLQKPAVTVWLLRLKRDRFGFSGHRFSL